MAIRIVQSKLNPRVKELRAALRLNRATPEGLVGLEGLHLLEEALRAGIEVVTIFVAQGHEHLLSQPPMVEFNPLNSVEILSLPRELLDAAATTETPQPIAALVRPRSWKWPRLFTGPSPLLVVLGGVQDPGNLGAILRSAEAFAATGAVLLPGTVSCWNAKAMRASAGSVFRLPTLSATEQDCFEQLRAAGVRTLAAMPRAENGQAASNLEAINLTRPTALFIGSEGSGISPEIAAQCTARVTIPCPGPVESLNAAIAASILLYEAARQRALPASKHGRSPRETP
jgi:TrmH family RNA methyltransferase